MDNNTKLELYGEIVNINKQAILIAQTSAQIAKYLNKALGLSSEDIGEENNNEITDIAEEAN